MHEHGAAAFHYRSYRRGHYRTIGEGTIGLSELSEYYRSLLSDYRTRALATSPLSQAVSWCCWWQHQPLFFPKKVKGYSSYTSPTEDPRFGMLRERLLPVTSVVM